MDRQQMIEALVRFSVDSVRENHDWLEKIFTEGVTGFGQLSAPQLLQEMQFRGLLEFDDEPAPVDEDDDEEDFEDELERLVAWSGMVTVETAESTTE